MSRAVAVDVPPGQAGASPRPMGRVAQRYRRIAVGLALGDSLAALLAVLIASALVRPGLDHAWSWLVAVLAPVVVVIVFLSYGLYRVTRLTPAQEFRRLFAAVSVAVIVLGLAVNVLAQFGTGESGGSLGVGWIGATWVLLLVLAMFGHKVWHAAINRLRRNGSLAYRTLIVGDNLEARELARRLAAGGIGYHAIGLISGNLERTGGKDDPGGADVLGTVADVTDVMERYGVECAFIVLSATPQEQVTQVLQAARRAGVEVRVSASMPEILVSRLSLQTIGGTLAMSLDPATLSGSQALLKRVFDVVVASLSIVVTSPLWLLAAVAIKTTSHGPVFFIQKRVGRGGKAIRVHKFRTMVVDAEARRQELLGISGGPLFKLEVDPRVTRVGRLLRRWSIDELPQLLDVMRGDMSMVGPRPLVMFDQAEIEEWHLQRLEVLPGITGLWQVSGRSDLTFDDCVQLDIFYIENWSITYDLYIMLKTIPAVLRRRGAY